jgi:hypothetical protein
VTSHPIQNKGNQETDFVSNGEEVNKLPEKLRATNRFEAGGTKLLLRTIYFIFASM